MQLSHPFPFLQGKRLFLKVGGRFTLLSLAGYFQSNWLGEEVAGTVVTWFMHVRYFIDFQEVHTSKGRHIFFPNSRGRLFIFEISILPFPGKQD